MQNIRKITDSLLYVGASDRRLALFENVYPVPNGVSYNSYLLLDEKNVLLDTADNSIAHRFFENVAAALDGRRLDYLVINHMEPDHCALIGDIMLRYPELSIVTNAKAVAMIKQFFSFDIDARTKVVAEGDTLCTGKHTLQFFMAPMVHWPEVMVTFDTTSGTLFSADAFGTFGAIAGNIFADEMDFDRYCLDEARRYYANIVGKYGVQVQSLLKKASALDIKMICPLHGPVWRYNLGYFIEKYDKWSRYEPEANGVMIIYGSIYGNTENAADILAAKLADKGVQGIVMYDVSKTDVSVLVSEAFKFSHIVLASSTYNNGIFTPMENFLLDIKAHALQNRTVAVIENGTWAPQSGKLIRATLDEMKNISILGDTVTLKSSLKSDQFASIENLADIIANEIKK
ncbi:MAG: FprA family A-type flavoprotein [Bacteroidales bacterium]|nr:FprA family A-type flavoprotein [Bacteroidales bacterium]